VHNPLLGNAEQDLTHKNSSALEGAVGDQSDSATEVSEDPQDSDDLSEDTKIIRVKMKALEDEQ